MGSRSGLGEFGEFGEWGAGSTKAWTSKGEFGEFGEWGAGSTKAWTSRGRHERMGALNGAWRRIEARRGTKDSDLCIRAYYTGLSFPLPLSRLFLRHTGASVYPVASQTTVSAQTPPLPVVSDFTAAKNISRSSGNSNNQGGRGRRSRRESRRGRGRDWRCGWQG